MIRKRVIALLMTTVIVLTLAGPVNAKKNTGSSASDRSLLTIEMYNVAANYQGVQGGWFGKLIKDKFNIELNIIAPQVAGDAQMLYQTRTASGKLGDFIILDNADLQDCIQAGLILDITEDVKSSKNLSLYYDQYEFFNAMLEGNEDGRIYGLPCTITNTSPSSYSQNEVYVSPMLPWDYFTEVGAPEMKDLDDLLDVLEQIVDKHPKADDGVSKMYPITLWPDWDSNYVEPIAQLSKWYGYEVKDSILLGYEGDIKELVAEDGSYYKMAKFMNDAFQRGLLDTDSATQNWDNVVSKMTNRQVLLLWYMWQRGFWNTPDRGNERTSYIYAPVDDLQIYQPSDSYYGEIRAFAIGSHIKGEARERIVEFMDWLTSPEGLNYLHVGIEGWSYTIDDDGKHIITDNGLYGYMENREVPAEMGGGGYYDGESKINQWPMADVSKNPNTGESYVKDFWSSYLELNKTTMTNEWSEKYGADYQVPYLLSTGQLHVVPNVNLILPSDSTDIALIRGQCGTVVKDSTWRAIYAKNDTEFEKIWSDMKSKLEGFGWEQLVEYDTQKFQAIVDARNAATAD